MDGHVAGKLSQVFLEEIALLDNFKVSNRITEPFHLWHSLEVWFWHGLDSLL